MTLRALKERGFVIGLISDCSSEVPAMWNESPFAALIDAPLFSATEGIKKPDTAIFLRVCERLQVKPSACLYVGDGGSDELVGATAAGMHAVQVRYGDTDALKWAGAVVNSLAGVLDHCEPVRISAAR